MIWFALAAQAAPVCTDLGPMGSVESEMMTSNRSSVSR